jgi:superoxide dismutase, Cu-Zn family
MKKYLVGFCLSLMFIQGCWSDKQEGPKNAIAFISATAGNDTQGIVRFSQEKEGVRVRATITGLTPGNHGFHIHQFGDITRSDGKAAGGHFNPELNDHAHRESEKRHVGDLGNIEADKDGYAYIEFVDARLKLSGNHAIIGRGIIVHAGSDDLTSQPTGAAGARVGQAVIGIAKK